MEWLVHHERGVVFTLGRFQQVKGPGLVFIIPAILLRYLETLTVIGADKNTRVVFLLPMDFVAPFLKK